MGNSHPVYLKSRRQKAAKLAGMGLTIFEIAKQCGTSESTIARDLKKYFAEIKKIHFDIDKDYLSRYLSGKNERIKELNIILADEREKDPKNNKEIARLIKMIDEMHEDMADRLLPKDSAQITTNIINTKVEMNQYEQYIRDAERAVREEVGSSL